MVSLLRPLPARARHLPVARRSVRRDRRQAKRALRAARHGRYCRVIAAIELIDHVGRARRPLVAVERILRRARVARHCVDRGHRGPRVPAHVVDGGGTAPAQPPHPAENDQGEGQYPPLPIGPRRPRPGGRGPPTNTEATAASAGRLGGPGAFGAAVDDPISIFTRTDLGNPFAGNPSLSAVGTPLDPSSATAGNVVLVSGNLYLAISTDGGRTFTYKDPLSIYATSKPASLKNPDGGACCDQVLQYDAATDRFYWLLQYWCTVQSDCKKRPGENRYRLAVASPKDVVESGGTRWRFWDLTSRDLGLKGNWMDFPDMALGRKFLYLTFNSPSGNSAFWARFRKSGLRDGTLDWWYHRFQNEYLLKPVQNTRGTAYAVRRSMPNELELKRWPETTTDVLADRIPIYTTPNRDCVAKSPDGQDFLSDQGCAGFSSGVSGAAMEGTRNDGPIWVAWTGGRREMGTINKDGSENADGAVTYPQPHIELAVLNPRRRSLVDQPDLWSQSTAYAYPALTAGPSGEAVLTYMALGAGQYPGWGVGFLTNRRGIVRVATGTVGATRVGDYLAVRPAWPSTRLFAATGNVIDAYGFQPYYALFGRLGDRPPRPPVRRRPVLRPPPRPTPSPTPTPTPPPAKPDLVIDDVYAFPGDAGFEVRVDVRNAGMGAAPATKTGITPEGSPETLVDTPPLASGATTTVSAPCPYTTGSATARADATNAADESDEGNNAGSSPPGGPGILFCRYP